jgi:hypothetical protein
MLDANLFWSDVAVVSFVWAQEDIPEVFYPSKKLECQGRWVNGVVQGALSWGVHCAVTNLMQRFEWEDGWEEQQYP